MTLGSHQRTIGASQVHVTPRAILDPLGAFDLDPCAAEPRPWDCAAVSFGERDDGLAQAWFGRVWLNPPFDRRVVGQWLQRMARHGRGVALVHARTETAWFGHIWEAASGLLFLAGRVIFHRPDGSPCRTAKGEVANSGAPVVLASFGAQDAECLAFCGIRGRFVPLLLPRAVVVAALAEASWREVVADFLARQRGPVALDALYRALASHPKTRANRHWRAKLRQTLRRGEGSGFSRAGRGLWQAGAAHG